MHGSSVTEEAPPCLRWLGEVGPEDAREDELFVREEFRIFSVYQLDRTAPRSVPQGSPPIRGGKCG